MPDGLDHSRLSRPARDENQCEAGTIEALENDIWPAPGPDATSMARRVHALRKQPVAELDADGLRLLLSQHVGVDVDHDQTRKASDRIGSLILRQLGCPLAGVDLVSSADRVRGLRASL